MKKFLILALFLAGCAGASPRYRVVCKDAPGYPDYHGWKQVKCEVPPHNVKVTVTTFWGPRTYWVWDCRDTHRVYKWQRIKK